MRNQNSPRGGFTFWEVVLLLGGLVILAVILFPVFNRGREPHRSHCMSNLKQIGLGFKQYIQDYDLKYPHYDLKYPPAGAANTELGWAVALQPYLKSAQIFQCDKEPNGANSDPTQPGYTDYWFNGRIARAPESSLEHQALTIINGDGESSDASYNLRSIPQDWRSDTASPLFRHLEGANYAFVDGHAKWYRPDQWKSELDMTHGPTFRLKPLVKPKN